MSLTPESEALQKAQQNARDWQACCRNLAMVIQNCADYLDEARANGFRDAQALIDTAELRTAFQKQAIAHGLKVDA